TATDACGNQASYTQYINVSDNSAPVWGNNVSEFVYECGSEAAVVTPGASDDCSEYTVSYTDGEYMQLGCTGAFERVWVAVDACGNASEEFVQYISFEDTTDPTLNGCPADLVLNCDDEIPAPASVTALDGCDSDVQVYYEENILGETPAEGSIADCDLITPARPAGNSCGYSYDWAMMMYNMPNAHRWYQVAGGSLVQYPGGSIHLVAQLENVLNPGTGWNVDVWFEGGWDWAAWSSQSFPTSYKADCGGVDANFASWTYFLLQAGPDAELSGYGNYAGSAINLAHAPANNYFGFQLGDGANNYNAADNAFGGWFSYSGTFRANADQSFTNVSGAGDFAFELDCCPDYTIERQWTAVDCSGNSTTCTQSISFSPSVAANGGSEGQSAINTEAISTERIAGEIQVSPNPANTNAMFTFKAAHEAKTTLELYNLTGKKVADVFIGVVEAGSVYNVNFNVSDLAAGLYTYRLTNGNDVKIDRLIIGK
ncbi:MAG: T9SS type A sorting domain-containing protein, partial [Flavobacteriales bacterium]